MHSAHPLRTRRSTNDMSPVVKSNGFGFNAILAGLPTLKMTSHEHVRIRVHRARSVAARVWISVPVSALFILPACCALKLWRSTRSARTCQTRLIGGWSRLLSMGWFSPFTVAPRSGAVCEKVWLFQWRFYGAFGRYYFLLALHYKFNVSDILLRSAPTSTGKTGNASNRCWRYHWLRERGGGALLLCSVHNLISLTFLFNFGSLCAHLPSDARVKVCVICFIVFTSRRTQYQTQKHYPES